ncbi:MAG: hypothetical protein V3T18_01695 [Pseudomonadales bacterium]
MNGLEVVLVDLLSTLSNASLALDPLATVRLSALEGTRVQFEFAQPAPAAGRDPAAGKEPAAGRAPAATKEPAATKKPAATKEPAATQKPVAEKNLTLLIADGRLEFTPGGDAPTAEDGQPHAIVRGSIPSVLAWLTGAGGGSDTLTFEGDEAILAELTGILRSYEPDLAEPLTSLLGDEAAESLIGAAEMAFATFRSMLESASSAVGHSAGRSFVSTPKLDTLLTGLDALQLRTDRLAAKVRAAERTSERVEDPQ